MADYTPVYTNGLKPNTKTASAAIAGGQLLEVTGSGTVGPAGAASLKCIGVAGNDAINGGKVTVWPLAAEHETTTPAGVTAGDSLAVAAAGTVNTVVPATGAAAATLIGVALTTAGAAAKCRWTGKQ